MDGTKVRVRVKCVIFVRPILTYYPSAPQQALSAGTTAVLAITRRVARHTADTGTGNTGNTGTATPITPVPHQASGAGDVIQPEVYDNGDVYVDLGASDASAGLSNPSYGTGVAGSVTLKAAFGQAGNDAVYSKYLRMLKVGGLPCLNLAFNINILVEERRSVIAALILMYSLL